MKPDLVIIGAGPAAMAAGHEIRQRGIPLRMIEQADRPAPSWSGRHEHLRLNTHRRYSHLPGFPIPRSHGALQSRDGCVDYLERYLEWSALSVEFGVAAQFTLVPEIESSEADRVRLVDGQTVAPDTVIPATGYRIGLEPLVGHRGALTESGNPLFLADEGSSECPGFGFFGPKASISAGTNLRRGEDRRLADRLPESSRGTGEASRWSGRRADVPSATPRPTPLPRGRSHPRGHVSRRPRQPRGSLISPLTMA